MELSTEIQEARKKLGLSQSQAAKAWDLKLITLQSWEQGVRKPRGFALKHLRAILDTALQADQPGSKPAASPPAPSSTASDSKLRLPKRPS